MKNIQVQRIHTTLYYIVRRLRGLSPQDFLSFLYLLSGGSSSTLALVALDDMLRGDALLDATKNGNMALVASIAASGPIATGYRAEAVVVAAPTGNVPLVDLLLTYPDCPGALTADSYITLVTSLSTNINEADRGRAICAAAEAGSVTVCNRLLDDGDIYDEDRGYAVTLACQGNYPVVVDRLLTPTGTSIPVYNAGKAVCASTQVGSKELVEKVLGVQHITECDRGEAVVIAAGSGRLDILEVLVADGTIRNNARGEALVAATTAGEYSCVHFLLTHPGYIPVLSRGEALFAASKRGDEVMVQEIVQSGTITNIQYKASIWIAHKSGYQNIVDLLVAASLWPLEEVVRDDVGWVGVLDLPY